MGSPVIAETPQVRNDEAHIRILAGEQLDRGNLPDYVIQHRQRKGAGNFANLTRNSGIVAMHLDPAKTILLDCLANQRENAASIALGVDERKAIESIGTAEDNARDLAIGGGIVGVEGGEDHRTLNARLGSPAHVRFERRVGVPGTRKAVSVS